MAKNILKRIVEAGRRNSSVDQARIQEAHDHMVGLGAECAAATKESKEALRLAESLRVDDSFNSRIELLRKAARLLLANANGLAEYDSPYVYVRDCFDTDVIAQCGEEIYQIPYTVNGETVTLGTPIEVDVAYIPSNEVAETAGDEIVERKTPRTRIATKKEMDSEKVTEAAVQLDGDSVQLREGAVDANGAAQIKIIQPGWGSSGYYSPEVLKRDGPKIFTKGLHMFWNHQTAAEESARPEGNLNDLTAELTGDAVYTATGDLGPGLYAPIKVFEAYQSSVNDLSKSIGVSIRAAGRAANGKAEGREGPIIQSLESAKSIDFVTSPGAGGEILQLFEAARGRNTLASGTRGGQACPSDKSALESAAGQQKTQESEMEVKNLQEANAQLTAQAASIASQASVIAKLQESVLLSEAAGIVNHELTAIALPGITKQRLMRELIAAMPVKENAIDKAAYKTRIDEAVKAAVAEIAAITGAGEVKGLGALPTADESKQLDESAKSLEASFATLGLSESGAKLAAKGRN